MRRRLLIAGVIAIAAIILATVLLWPAARPAMRVAALDPARPRVERATGSAPPSRQPDDRRATPPASAVQRTPGLPASLQGSLPDGGVRLDAGGHVMPDLALRRLFDYFLSAIGELDIDAIRALLRAHVRGLHGERVGAEVIDWFDRYVDYQRALSAAEQGLPGDAEARLAFARSLRRRHFDAATADAFFGDEEAYADYTLARLRVGRDATLDDDEKAARLRDLEAALPEAQRASLAEANTAVIAEEQSRQYEAMGIAADTRHEERAALYGAEAADRLAELDRQRAGWAQRLADYAQARDAIGADVGLSTAQRRQRIGELRRRRFDGNEARRVESLEAIDQL